MLYVSESWKRTNSEESIFFFFFFTKKDQLIIVLVGHLCNLIHKQTNNFMELVLFGK